MAWAFEISILETRKVVLRVVCHDVTVDSWPSGNVVVNLISVPPVPDSDELQLESRKKPASRLVPSWIPIAMAYPIS